MSEVDTAVRPPKTRAEQRSSRRVEVAHRALLGAGKRILELEAALDTAIPWIEAAAASNRPAEAYAGLVAALRAVRNATPVSWQDDPEIDWTGIER